MMLVALTVLVFAFYGRRRLAAWLDGTDPHGLACADGLDNLTAAQLDDVIADADIQLWELEHGPATHYAACCEPRCGWTSPLRHTVEAALLDAADHQHGFIRHQQEQP